MSGSEPKTFSQIKQILKKQPVDRSGDDIQALKIYFKDNPFFQKYGKENGEKWLTLIYNAMKYESVKNNNYVIRYGEFGTTFYIILKGKVEVRIPVPMSEEFTFRELLAYIFKNYEFIIKNENSSKMLEIVKFYFPEWIEKGKKGKFNLNKDIAEDILYGEHSKKYLEKHGGWFPAFLEINQEGEKIEVKKSFEFMYLKAVTTLQNGVGFGELALLNDKPRAASILTLEDTHFALLEKEDFNKIMAKALRDKFAEQVAFLTAFPFLASLTRITKEKLWFMMKPTKYSIGQVVVSEGEELNNIYLVESGEFEVSKNMYVYRK